MPRAKSIIELLTERNPHLRKPRQTESERVGSQKSSSKKSASTQNTYHRDYHVPKEFKTWDDFNPDNLDVIYGRRLRKAYYEERNDLPDYPYLSKYDCIIRDEKTVVNVLTKWNHTIVIAALDATDHDLQPSFWIHQSGKNNWDEQECLDRLKKKSNGRKLDRWRPDAGAISAQEMEAALPLERLPKDYKMASGWKSRWISELFTDESGKLIPLWDASNEARPIKQIYTYCVDLGCRYGCIMTTEEAFIFRIKPRQKPPGKLILYSNVGKMRLRITKVGDCTQPALKKALATDGLVEFVSIPWENKVYQTLGNPKPWTVNLALWFVHILAGNHHKVKWDYPKLPDDQEREPSRRINKAESSAPMPGRKRPNYPNESEDGNFRPKKPKMSSSSS